MRRAGVWGRRALPAVALGAFVLAAAPVASGADAGSGNSDLATPRHYVRVARSAISVGLQPLGTMGKPFYRQFIFSKNTPGLVNVMVMSGLGRPFTSGTRSFLLLPRREARQPSAEVIQGNMVVVQVPSGNFFRFSPESLRVTAVGRGTFSDSGDACMGRGCAGPQAFKQPGVPLQEEGGFVVYNLSDGIVVDGGWARGGRTGFGDLARESTVRDAKGASCRVRNSVLFKIVPVQEIRLRQNSDAEIARAIASVPGCEQLDLTPLLSGTRSRRSAATGEDVSADPSAR